MGEEGGGLFMVNSVGTSAVREKTVFQASFKKKTFFSYYCVYFFFNECFLSHTIESKTVPQI